MRLALLAAVVALQAIAPPQRFLDGIWETDGYGLVFEFAGDTLKTFEVTRVSCIPADTLTAVPAPSGAAGAFSLPGTPLVMVFRREGEAARANYGFAAIAIPRPSANRD